MRPILTRFLGSHSGGPLNYSGVFAWAFFTIILIGKFPLYNSRETRFEATDRPVNWFLKYRMVFPPSALNNRVSAHWIEINHIFFIEMLKKIKVAQVEIE